MNTHDQICSVNPATEVVLQTYEMHSAGQIEQALQAADRAFRQWNRSPFSLREELVRRAGSVLRDEKSWLAGIISAEMGKPIVEAGVEIGKCAWACDYYADNAAFGLPIWTARGSSQGE